MERSSKVCSDGKAQLAASTLALRLLFVLLAFLPALDQLLFRLAFLHLDLAFLLVTETAAVDFGQRRRRRRRRRRRGRQRLARAAGLLAFLQLRSIVILALVLLALCSVNARRAAGRRRRAGRRRWWGAHCDGADAVGVIRREDDEPVAGRRGAVELVFDFTCVASAYGRRASGATEVAQYGRW